MPNSCGVRFVHTRAVPENRWNLAPQVAAHGGKD